MTLKGSEGRTRSVPPAEAVFTDAVLDEFFMNLRGSTDGVLLLDYDGTLAPFTIERDEARPYEGVIERLSMIQRLGSTRLVIISGRSLPDLQRLLEGVDLPELWGGHGWERRTVDGRIILPDIGKAHSQAFDILEGLATKAGVSERFERKTASVAIHMRGLDRDSTKGLVARIEREMAPLADSHGLEVRHFDGGTEFMVPGKDKGTAVDTILKDVESGTPVAFLGDDLTDEKAFEALAGKGLSILVRQDPRPTVADIWLRPPEGLIAFLDHWIESCS